MATQRIIVGISGASGFQYGVRALELLQGRGLEVHLVMSKGAEKTCELETDYRLADVTAMADVVHSPGEILYVERGIGKVAGSTRSVINAFLPPVKGLTQEAFTEKFVAILVLFCASGTGIFGAMHEGMTGDPSILYIKTVLDLFTAGIFATMLGFAVMTIDGHNHQSGSAHHNRHVDSVVAEVLVLVICGEPRDWL